MTTTTDSSTSSTDTDNTDAWVDHDISDVDSPQYIEAAQRRRDGLVLMLEKGTTHGNKYAVTALPQNFRDDDRPIRSYGDGGYIWEGDDIDTARAAMTDWKKENPR
jgi:hypothetical protein